VRTHGPGGVSNDSACRYASPTTGMTGRSPASVQGLVLRPRMLVTAPTMPLLAYAKRRLGNQLHSAATVKEAAQTQLCAYLSIALLLGLGGNALAGWWWADPLTALVIAAVALKEGRESWRGEGCCDAC